MRLLSREDLSPLANHRLGPARPDRLVAAILALALLAQAGSPVFVSACQRGTTAQRHDCPLCQVGARRAPMPACHAAKCTAPAPGPRGLMPCCFLSADAGGAQEAEPQVTLRAPQGTLLPLALAGGPDAAAARIPPDTERFVFPPGAGAPPGGTFSDLRHPILRL